MPDSPFLRVDELAALLRVPKSWVYAETQRLGPGSIPRYRAGRYLVFDPQEVLDWFRKTRRVGDMLGNLSRRPRVPSAGKRRVGRPDVTRAESGRSGIPAAVRLPD